MSAATWMYQGIWGVLTRWFRVPKGPPELPVHGPGAVESLRPAPAYLSYLKFGYWLMLVVMCGPLLFAWIVLLVMVWVAGVILAPIVLFIVFMLTVVTYLAIHLRYDSTWFVLTDRSMRIRRGIWVIHETTITFENVQNVTVNQGPVQRYFGIADVVVQTAGGGSARGPHGEDMGSTHMGLLQGLADASRVRDVILAKLGKSRTAGLGDEHHGGSGWTAEHVGVLREIRELALRT